MKYIESYLLDPYYNLALEEFVFEHMDKNEEYFMLWQNHKTIVLGKFQNAMEEINQKYVEKHGIRIARRLSGGGAVYHDKGNLNFTFIVNSNEAQDFNFNIFVKPIIKALKKIGIKAEYSGRNDVLIDGQKISGNSQYMKNGRLLHHGCIMLDTDVSEVANALKVNDAKFVSKSKKSVRGRVTTINEKATEPVSMDTFKELIKQSVFENNPIDEYRLTFEQEEIVYKLRDEKYATWEWNIGHFKSYEMKKQRKFNSGLVTAYLQVENGVINDIRIFGDFFGNGDISQLENQLKGVKLSSELKYKLNTIDLNNYMKGITAENLYELLMY